MRSAKTQGRRQGSEAIVAGEPAPIRPGFRPITLVGIALILVVAGCVPIDPAARRPTATGAESCGDWSAATVAVGAMVSARYGEIRGCQVFGTQVPINTLGNAREGLPGVIAIYQCAPEDTACRDGRTPHPTTGWQFFEPPYKGAVGILERSRPVIVDNAGHQMCFNLRAHAYDLDPGCH
jgi:hypothetical protein